MACRAGVPLCSIAVTPARTMRLMLGAAGGAALARTSVLDGESLACGAGRMRRVGQPLAADGGFRFVAAAPATLAPLPLRGKTCMGPVIGRRIRPRPQVKSAILLAALTARGTPP